MSVSCNDVLNWGKTRKLVPGEKKERSLTFSCSELKMGPSARKKESCCKIYEFISDTKAERRRTNYQGLLSLLYEHFKPSKLHAVSVLLLILVAEYLSNTVYNDTVFFKKYPKIMTKTHKANWVSLINGPAVDSWEKKLYFLQYILFTVLSNSF